jgi:hypothetical protein
VSFEAEAAGITSTSCVERLLKTVPVG